MSQNWMRHFELLLLDKDGKGIKLSDLKVTFQIQKMPATIFNGFVGNFKVFNLSKETQARILKGEYARVQVIAGYDGNPDASGNYPDRNVGLIFNGDIRFTISGRDNPTDTWTLLQCIDAWEGHLKASENHCCRWLEIPRPVQPGYEDIRTLRHHDRHCTGIPGNRVPARSRPLSKFIRTDEQHSRSVQCKLVV